MPQFATSPKYKQPTPHLSYYFTQKVSTDTKAFVFCQIPPRLQKPNSRPTNSRLENRVSLSYAFDWPPHSLYRDERSGRREGIEMCRDSGGDLDQILTVLLIIALAAVVVWVIDEVF